MDKLRDQFIRTATDSLAALTNSEGELSFIGPRAAEALHNTLLGTPGYICTVPVGSRVGGGYEDASSDIDLFVVREQPPTEQKKRGTFAEALDIMGEQVQLESTFLDHKFDGQKVHVNMAYIDREAIEHMVATAAKSKLSGSVFWLRMLSPAAIGPKLEEYRALIGDVIRKLPKNQQLIVVNRFAKSIIEGETKSTSKMRTRLPELSVEQINSIFDLRQKKWEEQIRAILNI